jgi:hypothetical protein
VVEDTKGIIKIRASKKDRQHNGQNKKERQHNGQNKKDKWTNNDLSWTNSALPMCYVFYFKHNADLT